MSRSREESPLPPEMKPTRTSRNSPADDSVDANRKSGHDVDSDSPDTTEENVVIHLVRDSITDSRLGDKLHTDIVLDANMMRDPEFQEHYGEHFRQFPYCPKHDPWSSGEIETAKEWYGIGVASDEEDPGFSGSQERAPIRRPLAPYPSDPPTVWPHHQAMAISYPGPSGSQGGRAWVDTDTPFPSMFPPVPPRCAAEIATEERSEQEPASPRRDGTVVVPVPASTTWSPCCYGYRMFCWRCWRASGSIYAVPFWILLMLWPISSGFMGALYINECKMSPSVPKLLFMMGVTGVIAITIRVKIILQRAVCESEMTCCWGTILILMLITFVFFVTEIADFWTYNPSNYVKSPRYCDPTFYSYTFWVNCSTSTVMLVMAVLNIPICINWIRIRN